MQFNQLKCSKDFLKEKLDVDKNKYEGIILNVASHIKPKNVELVLKSLDKLLNRHGRNVYCILIGEGHLSKELKSLASKLNIQKNTLFIGKLPNQDVVHLMQFCDLLVHPDENPVFDYVILEAINSKLWVLTTKAGGNLEIIDEGNNGNYIKNLSVDNITSKILEIFR